MKRRVRAKNFSHYAPKSTTYERKPYVLAKVEREPDRPWMGGRRRRKRDVFSAGTEPFSLLTFFWACKRKYVNKIKKRFIAAEQKIFNAKARKIAKSSFGDEQK